MIEEEQFSSDYQSNIQNYQNKNNYIRLIYSHLCANLMTLIARQRVENKLNT